jgi:hypothetical protein
MAYPLLAVLQDSKLDKMPTLQRTNALVLEETLQILLL